MYIAHLATANYDFYLMADTEEIMWEELERTWNYHAKTRDASYTWEDVKDSVWWNKQNVNQVWRKG